MKIIEKYKVVFFWFFRSLLVIAGLLSAFQQNWINVSFVIFTLFLTFLPSIIERKLHFDYPSFGEFVIVLFIFASIYLGEMRKFYQLFWWWDLMLHAFSGVIIAIIGFSLVYILNKKKNLDLSPFLVAVFSFSFALAIGTIWEIFEFLMDSFLGINMQKSGLIDTMWDLILVLIGALLISCIGYLYLIKRIKIAWIRKIKEEFIRNNKKFFNLN